MKFMLRTKRFSQICPNIFCSKLRYWNRRGEELFYRWLSEWMSEWQREWVTIVPGERRYQHRKKSNLPNQIIFLPVLTFQHTLFKAAVARSSTRKKVGSHFSPNRIKLFILFFSTWEKEKGRLTFLFLFYKCILCSVPLSGI